MSVQIGAYRVGSMPADVLSAAREVHKAAFGDDDCYLDRLLAAGADGRYLCAADDNGVAAGCFLFDATLFSYGEVFHGFYLYALCTVKERRGLGYAGALLAAAKDAAGDFVLLCPANDRLAHTYRRHGFTCSLDGCTPSGGVPRGAAPGGFSPCGYDGALRAAKTHGGLLLSKPLFELSLFECGAAAYTDGDRFAAVGAEGLYAAIGVTPTHTVGGKALAYLKKDISVDGVFADLLLEV